MFGPLPEVWWEGEVLILTGGGIVDVVASGSNIDVHSLGSLRGTLLAGRRFDRNSGCAIQGPAQLIYVPVYLKDAEG